MVRLVKMFPSIVASRVVSSLNHPWLQGRGRRGVLMRTHPPPLWCELLGKDDKSGSLAMRNEGAFKVLHVVHLFAP